MPRLIVTSPEGKRGILELNKAVITIGRGTANDLVLSHPSVSRLHAVVKYSAAEDSVTLADRGSTNGVQLNGLALNGESLFAPGDIAAIGAFTLQLEFVNDDSLVLHPADLPSDVDRVLRGEGRPAKIAPIDKGASSTELIERIARLEQENYLLSVLFEAGKALTGKKTVEEIGAQVIELCFRIAGVERGFLMLLDATGEVTKHTEVRYRTRQSGAAQPKIILSRSVVERIRAEQQPLLILDSAHDERFSGSESMKIAGVQSAMCAPLIGAKRLLGLIYVDNLEKTSAFTQEELNVFALLAAQAAAAIDNALAHDELASQALRRTALERFLSPEVVEMIAANPQDAMLGGKNQMVTVLFADIRGFTSLSERMGPEKVVEVLNEYFSRATDVIFEMGGTLDKFIGDAVMAVFGAPLSKGHDALNAVRAAVNIQRLMTQLNRDAAARGWPELRVGIGINSGIVTAGNIGSPKRLDYTVIGDAVNTASRLMSHAGPGQVLISLDTASQLPVGCGIALKPLAPINAKGKSEPIRVFDVAIMQARGAKSAK